MKLAKLTETIREYETHLAPGSETTHWGDYVEDVRRHHALLPYDDHDPDIEAAPELVEHWLQVYSEDTSAVSVYDEAVVRVAESLQASNEIAYALLRFGGTEARAVELSNSATDTELEEIARIAWGEAPKSATELHMGPSTLDRNGKWR